MMGAAWAVFLLPLAALAADGAEIVGQWTVPDGETRVEIYRAADGTFEGKICWFLEPNFPAGDAEAGKPRHDRYNPDKSLQSRPLLGLVLMKGFKFDGKKKWSGGTIYDPESGKTYKGKMELDNDQTLSLRGFVGVSLLGRTEKWTRYKQPK
jgi:uncharacterized protein (DUF2147 family)